MLLQLPSDWLVGEGPHEWHAMYESIPQKPALSGELCTDSGLRTFKPSLCLANLQPGTIKKFLVKSEVLLRYMLSFQILPSWMIRHCRTGLQPLTRHLEASFLLQFTGWEKRPGDAFTSNLVAFWDKSAPVWPVSQWGPPFICSTALRESPLLHVVVLVTNTTKTCLPVIYIWAMAVTQNRFKYIM